MLQPAFISNKTFSYLSCDTLMTCVPVLEDEHLQFLWRVTFGNFCLNWFKLVSAKPPNSQTLNQKGSCSYTFKDWWIEILFSLGFDALLKVTPLLYWRGKEPICKKFSSLPGCTQLIFIWNHWFFSLCFKSIISETKHIIRTTLVRRPFESVRDNYIVLNNLKTSEFPWCPSSLSY